MAFKKSEDEGPKTIFVSNSDPAYADTEIELAYADAYPSAQPPAPAPAPKKRKQVPDDIGRPWLRWFVCALVVLALAGLLAFKQIKNDKENTKKAEEQGNVLTVPKMEIM